MQLQGIKCFLSEFIPYFLVLVPGYFATLPNLNCKESHGSRMKHHMNCGFNLIADLKTSVAKNCKCF